MARIGLPAHVATGPTDAYPATNEIFEKPVRWRIISFTERGHEVAMDRTPDHGWYR